MPDFPHPAADHPLDQALDLRRLARDLAAFRRPSNGRGAFELAVSAVPLVLLWLLMWLSLDLSYAVTMLLAVPAAGFLLRLFMIQHDCGHGAFLKSRRANDWVGRCLGVLTLSPYDLWRRGHAMHHAGTGNLDRRGIGDVDTLTVREYAGHGLLGRLRYRLYRHPAIMLGIGPAWLFLLRYRLPLGEMRGGWRPWLSAMGTNGAIAVLSAALMLLVGVRAFLMIQLPITLIAASVGVWLFYVQHQFEHTRWTGQQEWQFHEAALFGSSHYVLPKALRWLTANIGMHHMHHLCSTVPFYRLPAALHALPGLAGINHLTVRDSVRSFGLVLWDERASRLVSFREARANGLGAAARNPSRRSGRTEAQDGSA